MLFLDMPSSSLFEDEEKATFIMMDTHWQTYGREKFGKSRKL